MHDQIKPSLLRPDTAQSYQESSAQRTKPIEHDAIKNFVGLVLSSLPSFKHHIETGPESEDDFGLFYRKYLDDMEVWSVDLQTRLQQAFRLTALGTRMASASDYFIF